MDTDEIVSALKLVVPGLPDPVVTDGGMLLWRHDLSWNRRKVEVASGPSGKIRWWFETDYDASPVRRAGVHRESSNGPVEVTGGRLLALLRGMYSTAFNAEYQRLQRAYDDLAVTTTNAGAVEIGGALLDVQTMRNVLYEMMTCINAGMRADEVRDTIKPIIKEQIARKNQLRFPTFSGMISHTRDPQFADRWIDKLAVRLDLLWRGEDPGELPAWVWGAA